MRNRKAIHGTSLVGFKKPVFSCEPQGTQKRKALLLVLFVSAAGFAIAPGPASAVVQNPKVVAGGGAPETEASAKLRRWAEKLSGREQLAALAFAESLEVIPITLAQNAGLDPIDIIVDLRAKHEKGEKWYGVNAIEGKATDMAKLEVYEPLVVKAQIIKAASEAAIMILRVDDVIAGGKSRAPAGPPMPPGGGMGGMGGME